MVRARARIPLLEKARSRGRSLEDLEQRREVVPPVTELFPGEPPDRGRQWERSFVPILKMG